MSRPGRRTGPISPGALQDEMVSDLRFRDQKRLMSDPADPADPGPRCRLSLLEQALEAQQCARVLVDPQARATYFEIHLGQIEQERRRARHAMAPETSRLESVIRRRREAQPV